MKDQDKKKTTFTLKGASTFKNKSQQKTESAAQEFLPPPSTARLKEKRDTGLGNGEEEITLEDFEADEFIINVCRDVIGVPFEIWALATPGTEELSEKEKERLSKPLARIAIKYNFAKFLKDEYLFTLFLAAAVIKRIPKKRKAKKKNANHDTGQKRKRENDLSKESHPQQ